MASTYSPSLKIELMGTGDQTGTWGTTTNNNFLYALEEGLLGYINISFASDANKTLTLSDSNAAQDARNLYLYVTSGVSLTATRDLIVPTTEKPYIVHNATTGSQSIRVKTAAGTGITIPNGSKALVYADGTNVSMQFTYVELVAPVLGTPSSGTLTNCTIPVGGISGLGANVATFLATPTSANLAAAVTDETGSGALVFGTSPTLATPVISSIVNTGTLTLPTSTDTLVGRATTDTLTNKTLTAPVISSIVNTGTLTLPTSTDTLIGRATTDTLTNKTINLASNTLTATSAQIAAAVSDETGSGALVFATSPTLVTPNLGTPSSGTLTSCTGLPIVAGTTGTLSVARGGTGITAFGTGVAAALGVNVGSSGAFVVNGGALGTPSSGTLTSCTGLPIAGVSGLGTNVATALAVNVGSAGAFVTNGGALGTPSSGTLTSCTGLPIVAGTTGTLSVARGGTGVTTSTGTGNVVLSASPTFTGTLSAATIEATGNITAYYSDDRLKTRLNNIENALEKLCSLTGFYYEANQTAQALGYKVEREVGVSAQEVQKVLPEVVVAAPISDEYLTVRYERIIPLIIEAVKELSSQVTELRGK